MSRTTRPPAPVRWEEGMLLSPHHFQQQDLYRDALLELHTSLLAPYHWGVLELTVDEEALARGLFRVVTLVAVLPDGLVARHEDSIDHRLELDLSSVVDEIRVEPRTIRLSVAARRDGQSALDGELARFRPVDGHGVLDLNTGENEMHVPRLVPQLHLDDRERPSHSWVELPLARVGIQNETPVLTEYEPPRLEVRRDSTLGRIAGRVAQRLHEKANFLSDLLERPAAADQGPHLLEKRLLLHAVVSSLPRLRTLLASDRVHPYPLFLTLCDVVGRVAIAGRHSVPPEIPYDHRDLRRSFRRLADEILSTLDEGINEVWLRRRMRWIELRGEPDRFRIRLLESWRDADLVLGVRTSRSGSREKTMQWLERAAIGTRRRMVSILDRRVEGARRSREENVEALVPSGDVTLYRLPPSDESIEPGDDLDVVNRDESLREHRPSEILLFVRAAQRETRQGESRRETEG